MTQFIKDKKYTVLLTVCILILLGFITLLILDNQINKQDQTYDYPSSYISYPEQVESYPISTPVSYIKSNIKNDEYEIQSIELPRVINNQTFKINCENNDNICRIYEIENNILKNVVYKFRSSQASIFNTYWSPNKKYIVYQTALKAFLVNTKTWEDKKILEWKDTDIGVGGPGCSETNFSPNSEHFTFCIAQASAASKQGQLYIYNENGDRLGKINTKRIPSTPGIIWNIFIDNKTILLEDREQKKIFTYNINKKTKELYLDKSLGDNVEISKNREYLEIKDFTTSSKPKYTYLNIDTKELSDQKPEGIEFITTF